MEDRFNEGMSCITHFVFLHIILRKSQILLTFSRQQMMYNVSNDVLCAKVTYINGTLSYGNKGKNKVKR